MKITIALLIGLLAAGARGSEYTNAPPGYEIKQDSNGYYFVSGDYNAMSRTKHKQFLIDLLWIGVEDGGHGGPPSKEMEGAAPSAPQDGGHLPAVSTPQALQAGRGPPSKEAPQNGGHGGPPSSRMDKNGGHGGPPSKTMEPVRERIE